jgi:hypothetical protein
VTVRIDDDGVGALTIRDGDVELVRYTYVPDTVQFESPKPYLHPIRTRAGRLVSLFRPWDHVWHKGIAWSLPVVGDENFWGGVTYVHGQGYVQLPNNGAQVHQGGGATTDGTSASYAHDLEWIAEDGRRLFAEQRQLGAHILDDTAWALTFDTALTNVSDESIPIGSPTTRGRDNAGYGGLFWRGPRSFTDGLVVTDGVRGTGDELRGHRHAWMGYVGRHDDIDEQSLVVMVDDAANPQHPPQWFVRSEPFACLNPAPFFSEELVVAPGETVRFRYAVAIADAGADAAPALAAAARTVL